MRKRRALQKTNERDKQIIQIDLNHLNSFLLSESYPIQNLQTSLFILLEQWDFYNGVINAKSAKRARWRHKKVGHICRRRRGKWLCANFTGKESRQFKAFSFFWFSFHSTALSFITHKQVITVKTCLHSFFLFDITVFKLSYNFNQKMPSIKSLHLFAL